MTTQLQHHSESWWYNHFHCQLPMRGSKPHVFRRGQFQMFVVCVCLEHLGTRTPQGWTHCWNVWGSLRTPHFAQTATWCLVVPRLCSCPEVQDDLSADEKALVAVLIVFDNWCWLFIMRLSIALFWQNQFCQMLEAALLQCGIILDVNFCRHLICFRHKSPRRFWSCHVFLIWKGV